MTTLPLIKIPPRTQELVVWEKTPEGSSAYGESSFSAPVEIRCRWDGSVEQGIVDQMAERKVSATLYPDYVLKEGDYVYKGTLASLGTGDTSRPSCTPNSIEIQKFQIVPSFNGKKFLLIAYAG